MAESGKKYILVALFSLLLFEGLTVGFTYLYPHLPDDFYFGGDTLRLHFYEPAELLAFTEPGSAKADSLLENTDSLLAMDFSEEGVGNPKHAYVDTGENPLFVNPKLPDGHYALDNFFSALYALEAGKLDRVHVAHYGDSQTEGDRITRFIRLNLQQRFGGNGLGLVGITDIASHHSLSRSTSGNWLRYTVFKNNYNTGSYNMGGVVFRFVAPSAVQNQPRDTLPKTADPDELLPDSVQNDTAAPPPPDPTGVASIGAFVQFNIRKPYDYAQLVYGKVFAPTTVKIYADGSFIREDELEEGSNVRTLELEVPAGSENLKLEFEAEGESPEIYGLMLDCYHGVQVDNFGLRGHSGNGLMRINFGRLSRQYAMFDTRLIIVQYGGNAAPMTNVYDWSFFADAVYNIVSRLKRAAPKASVLVVGVADAAGKREGEFGTLHTIPRIRDAQRQGAKRAGAAFWDLYEAMGGRNSIISWVNHDPPLAAKDFAHFSWSGQKVVGNMLVKALLNEYARYRDSRASFDPIEPVD